MILSGASALCARLSLDLFKSHKITESIHPGRGGTASYRFISR
jgi:hypothetical protein